MTVLWLAAAVLSAVFAGLTSVLAKCGIKKTDKDILISIVFSYFVFKPAKKSQQFFRKQLKLFLR